MNGLTKLYNIRRIELAYSYSTISGIGKEILDIIEEIVKILQKEKLVSQTRSKSRTCCKRMMICSKENNHVERIYKPIRITHKDKAADTSIWREFYSFSYNELLTLTEKITSRVTK